MVPIIRSAAWVHPDLIKGSMPDESRYGAHHSDSFADGQAKRMMGAANPMTGADNRAAGSTACPSCGRWHRPGSMCTKSMETTTVLKGRRVAVYHSPGNSFRDPGTGSYANAPKSGNAAAEVAVERAARIATAHHDQQLANPPVQMTSDMFSSDLTSPGVSQQAQPQGQGQAAAPRPAPPPVPTTIRGVHTLLTHKPEPKTPSDPGKRLVDNSAHLQNQQTSYLNALRQWQSLHAAPVAPPIA